MRLTVAAGAGGATTSVAFDAAVDLAWAAIQGEFAAVDAAMSRYREDSEITRLNRAGSLAAPSRRLVAAISAADRAGRITDGLFDATIVRDLERLGSIGVRQARDDRDPSAADQPAGLPAAARQPSHSYVRRSGRRGAVSLAEPIDLGGIGKGLALRWAARRAAALLDAGFLLEAGGDIASRGLFGEARWSIGIEDPAAGAEPLAVCVLEEDQAIATSSTRIGRWLDPAGRPVHHLIDPRTGLPGGAGLTAVSVAFPDPAWAEVWSKALFLEGAAGIARAARHRGLAAWWVNDAGELSMTPAARQQTSWVRDEARRRDRARLAG
ncbi:MAG TPA: FAD:protein FMN transferase [Candidatus Dormibacteraeota bacterium]|nr:FAD:protein FMN transferase [Candidatus Dormibacteraeota bacterium]